MSKERLSRTERGATGPWKKQTYRWLGRRSADPPDDTMAAQRLQAAPRGHNLLQDVGVQVFVVQRALAPLVRVPVQHDVLPKAPCNLDVPAH